MVFFGDNGPKITNQSFKLPKQHFKTKLQGFKKSGQKCHVRYAHSVMSVTLYFPPLTQTAMCTSLKKCFYI